MAKDQTPKLRWPTFYRKTGRITYWSNLRSVFVEYAERMPPEEIELLPPHVAAFVMYMQEQFPVK